MLSRGLNQKQRSYAYHSDTSGEKWPTDAATSCVPPIQSTDLPYVVRLLLYVATVEIEQIEGALCNAIC